MSQNLIHSRLLFPGSIWGERDGKQADTYPQSHIHRVSHTLIPSSLITNKRVGVPFLTHEVQNK